MPEGAQLLESTPVLSQCLGQQYWDRNRLHDKGTKPQNSCGEAQSFLKGEGVSPSPLLRQEVAHVTLALPRLCAMSHSQIIGKGVVPGSVLDDPWISGEGRLELVMCL